MNFGGIGFLIMTAEFVLADDPESISAIATYIKYNPAGAVAK